MAPNEQQTTGSEARPTAVAPASGDKREGGEALESSMAPTRGEALAEEGREPPMDSEGSGVNERVEKMSRLRAEGREPYPHARVPDRARIAAVLQAHPASTLGHGEHPALRYTLAGRLTSRRVHGRRAFLDLRDNTGEIQLYAQSDVLGPECYEQLLRLDIGDIISANGCLYLTQRGEVVLNVHGFELLTKALRPPSTFQSDGVKVRKSPVGPSTPTKLLPYEKTVGPLPEATEVSRVDVSCPGLA
jgi:hypothetical protein